MTSSSTVKKSPPHIKRYLIAGLLVWVPIWVTLLVIRFIINLLDKTLALLPDAYQPQVLLGYDLPGLGLLLSLVIVFSTGIFITHFLGHKLVHFWEAILARIPLVRTIYGSAKQIVSTLLSTGGDSFRKVLLVEYPRKGLWSIAFLTSRAGIQPSKKTDVPMLTVFIPTTPNPTSGFLIMVPEADAVEIDISVDEALKFVISLGVIHPNPALEADSVTISS